EGGSGHDSARFVQLLGGTGSPTPAPRAERALTAPRGAYWHGEQAWRRGDRATARTVWATLPPGLWRHLADAELAWLAGDTQTAWQGLSTVARLDPAETQTYVVAGEWAMAAGDVGRALRAWQWGQRLGLPDPWLLTGLARLYVHLDQPGGARELCRQVLTIRPNHAAAFETFWQELLQAPWQPHKGTGETPMGRSDTPMRSTKA
ncbi:MAG: hypothetical protein H7338_19875, partial [Candidatus Sericytochromatia bacterium]|nr:hypothetical protein [Candidatus Sericytochromatia bacterium]